MSVQAEPSAAFELSRPAPTHVKVVFGLLFALSLSAVPGAVVLTLAVCSPGGNGFLWLHELTASSPFGIAPWVGTGIALLALSLVLDKLYQARARRRYGRCRIEEDELVFEPCLGGGEERVALDDVTGFTITSHGVIVDALDRSSLLRATRPLFTPIGSPDEQARILAYMEAAREHAPGQASFGTSRPTWVRVGLGLLLLSLSAPALVLFPLRFGQLALTFVAIPVVFLQLPGLLLFERRVLGPRWTQVHFGRRALWWGDQRVPWSEVTRVAWSETDLIVEAGQTRLCTHVAPRLEEAKRLLGRRLAGAGSRLDPDAALPAWAAPPARRKRAAAYLALVLAVPAAATGLALTDPPIHDTIVVRDYDGVEMTLLHRITDDAPHRLRIADPERGIDFEVDVSGSDQDLTSAAREAAQPFGGIARKPQPIAVMLDGLLPDPEEPRLRDWLEGRIGQRTFRVTDPRGWELIWGAERGRVLMCALIRPAAKLDAYLVIGVPSLELDLRGAGGPTYWDETLPLIRADGPGAVLAFPGPLPELEELLRATRAIRSGATIAESSRELRELQEAR